MAPESSGSLGGTSIRGICGFGKYLWRGSLYVVKFSMDTLVAVKLGLDTIFVNYKGDVTTTDLSWRTDRPRRKEEFAKVGRLIGFITERYGNKGSVQSLADILNTGKPAALKLVGKHPVFWSSFERHEFIRRLNGDRSSSLYYKDLKTPFGTKTLNDVASSPNVKLKYLFQINVPEFNKPFPLLSESSGKKEFEKSITVCLNFVRKAHAHLIENARAAAACGALAAARGAAVAAFAAGADRRVAAAAAIAGLANLAFESEEELEEALNEVFPNYMVELWFAYTKQNSDVPEQASLKIVEK